jgi:multimeric flavodoxin WrbA
VRGEQAEHDFGEFDLSTGRDLNIVAIVGSPRKNGNTGFLVDLALEEAAKLGITTEKIMLGDYRVGGCQGHERCASFASCLEKDDFEWILEKFSRADGLILATPVYYYNMTAQMKAFIDRNYFLYKKDRKPAARSLGIIVVAEGEAIEDTLHTLEQYVDSSLDILPCNRFIITGYASKPGDAQKNLCLVESARRMGLQLALSLLG